jgi:hypothetical protein
VIDLASVGWVPTKKRRPRQPLTGCLAGWLPVWNKEDEARRAAALAEDRTRPERGLMVYKGKRVATVKRAFRRIGTELGLMGFSQYSLRHFMADQIKKLFRNVPREPRSLWMGHVVRDGSRTTANHESGDPEMLADVALATDCMIALVQQHCGRRLFAVDEEGFARDRGAGDPRNAEKTESWWWRMQSSETGLHCRNREFFENPGQNRLSRLLQQLVTKNSRVIQGSYIAVQALSCYCAKQAILSPDNRR